MMLLTNEEALLKDYDNTDAMVRNKSKERKLIIIWNRVMDTKIISTYQFLLYVVVPHSKTRGVSNLQQHEQAMTLLTILSLQSIIVNFPPLSIL
jgi:hypothetical protein